MKISILLVLLGEMLALGQSAMTVPGTGSAAGAWRSDEQFIALAIDYARTNRLSFDTNRAAPKVVLKFEETNVWPVVVFAGKSPLPELTIYFDKHCRIYHHDGLAVCGGSGVAPTHFWKPDQIFDFGTFVKRLVQKSDAVSAYVWDHHVPPATQALLTNYLGGGVPTQMAKRLVALRLNGIVSGPPLDKIPQLAGVVLSTETTALLKKARPLNAVDSAVLNRLLLEDAYPRELLTRDQKSTNLYQ